MLRKSETDECHEGVLEASPSHMQMKRVAAYAAIYLLWGGSFLGVHEVVAIFPPFAAAAFRYLLAAVVLLAWSWARGQQAPTRIEVLHTLWTGAAMFTVLFGAVFYSSTLLPSWMVAALVSSMTLWTYVAECLFVDSVKLRSSMLLACAVGIGGILLLAAPGPRRGASGIALAMLLFGTLAHTVAVIAYKRVRMPSSPSICSGLQVLFGGLFLLLISATRGERVPLHSLSAILEIRGAVAMAYLVFGSTALGTVAFRWLMVREPASRIATCSYVNPVVAMLLSVLFLHEAWTVRYLIGSSALVLSALLLWNAQQHVGKDEATPRRRRRAQEKRPPQPEMA